MAKPETSAEAARPEIDASTRRLQIGSTLGGRFCISAKLGQGGMGTVYEVTTVDGEVLAAKVILGHGQERRSTKRFLREARATSKIESRHIVRIVELGHDEPTGQPFIVMERLRGADLGSFIRDNAPLPPAEIAALIADAARGLESAHASNVIHRDVKPANLFLHREGDDTITMKVCDFGIAKVWQDAVSDSTDLTAATGFLGSPRYMSPEQAKNAKTVDARSDVYGLAASLHEALSGDTPWSQCEALGEIVVSICTQNWPPLAEVAPWVDPGLARVVERALRRDPAARFASAADFADALAPFASSPVRFAQLEADPARVAARENRPARRDATVEAVSRELAQKTSGTASRDKAKRARRAFVLGGSIAAAGCLLFAGYESTREREVNAGPAAASATAAAPATASETIASTSAALPPASTMAPASAAPSARLESSVAKARQPSSSSPASGANAPAKLSAKPPTRDVW